MYKCEACGAVFDEPRRVTERWTDGEFWHKYETCCCPACGDEEFYPVKQCDCGAWTQPEEPMCEACRLELRAKLTRFVGGLSPSERETLNTWMDGDVIENCYKWR